MDIDHAQRVMVRLRDRINELRTPMFLVNRMPVPPARQTRRQDARLMEDALECIYALLDT